MNTLKQAVYLRCGDLRSYTDLPQSRLDALWRGYEELNWEACHWRAVMPDRVQGVAQRHGAEVISAEPVPIQPESGKPLPPLLCDSVPLRLLESGSESYVQGQMIVPPLNPGGTPQHALSAKRSRGVVLPSAATLKQAVSALLETQGLQPLGGSRTEDEQLLVHGVSLAGEEPVCALYQNMAHSDAFLYVTIRRSAPPSAAVLG
jgi:hypothetical protein